MSASEALCHPWLSSSTRDLCAAVERRGSHSFGVKYEEPDFEEAQYHNRETCIACVALSGACWPACRIRAGKQTCINFVTSRPFFFHASLVAGCQFFELVLQRVSVSLHSGSITHNLTWRRAVLAVRASAFAQSITWCYGRDASAMSLQQRMVPHKLVAGTPLNLVQG